jgi:hypothetical protein
MIDQSAVANHKRGLLCGEEKEQLVLDLFRAGESVNQIVFLIDYTWDAGKVCDVIRKHVLKLEGPNAQRSILQTARR